MEPTVKLRYPLVDKVRRTQHRKSLDIATVEQFARNERSLNSLADTDIVSDEQAYRIQLECHKKWHELISTGLDSDLTEAAERTCAAAKR
jgi:hypothetical protein